MTLPRTDWPAVALAISSGILAALCVGKVPPALPLLQHDLGLSLREVGWVASLFSTMAMLGAIFLGVAAGRVGALRMTLMGLAALAGGGLLGAAAPDYPALLLGRVLEGAGQISVTVAVPGLLVASCAPRQIRLVLGLWAAFLPLGISIALTASPLLLVHGHWRALWTLIAVLTLGNALWLWLWRGRYRHAVQAAATHGWRRLAGAFWQTAPWLLGLSFTAYAFQFFVVMTFLPTWLIQERGASLQAASTLSAAVILSNVGGIVLGATLVQRGLRPSSLILATHLIVGTAGLVIFSPGASDPARLAACFCLTLCGGLLPAATLSSAPRLAKAPEQNSPLQGLFLQFSNLGQFIAAPLITWAVTSTGGPPQWTNALPVIGSAMACGVLLAVATRLRGI